MHQDDDACVVSASDQTALNIGYGGCGVVRHGHGIGIRLFPRAQQRVYHPVLFLPPFTLVGFHVGIGRMAIQKDKPA